MTCSSNTIIMGLPGYAAMADTTYSEAQDTADIWHTFISNGPYMGWCTEPGRDSYNKTMHEPRNNIRGSVYDA